MAARISIMDADGNSRWFTLDVGQSKTVGRGTESDIIVLDRLVSRRHCEIVATQDGYVARDLASANGTYCDGRRVEIAELRDGSQIQIGNTKIRFSLPWVGRGSVVRRPRPTRTLARLAATVLALIVLAGAAVGGTHLVRLVQKTALAGSARRLNVTSTPDRAMVFVDGSYAGLTPLADVPISSGKHSVRLVKADCQTWSQAVPDGSGGVAIDAPLASAVSGILVVETDPPGAEVYIDGDRVGVTPLRLENVPVGERDIRLQKTNYVSHLEKVTVQSAKAYTVRCTLKIRQAETYLALLKADPNNCSYHCELAHVYLLDRRIDLAGKHLEQALDIYAQGKDSSSYAARLKWLFDKVYANDYFHWSADDAELQKMRDEVDRVFLVVMARHPDNSTLYTWLTSIHTVAGLPFDAKVLERFLKLDPETGMKACVATATRLSRGGEFQKAAEVLEMAAKTVPNSFDVYYALGKIQYRQAVKDTPSAIEPAVLNLTKARTLTSEDAKRHQIDAYLTRLSKLKGG